MFYKPKDAVAADVIPFFRNNAFQLFYLKDFRNVEEYGEGTPWYLVETEDFIHFEERGEVLARGKNTEQDLYVFTGSVFEWKGIYYIFYTGHNPYFSEEGKHQQAILMASSTDFHTWMKQKDFVLFPPENLEPHDFRDPFVFYNEETEKFNMLLAARISYGPSRRRGCTAIAVSDDLRNWKIEERPFYGPRLHYMHECPDLFRMGNWWYLVFSEFSEKCETHYCMAKDLYGPWISPKNDTFDNRNFYAAKTVTDGKNRYVIGWNPTNKNNGDFEETQWGGNIIVHQIVQEQDGQLFVKLPDSIKSAYNLPLQHREGYVIGHVLRYQNNWKIGKQDGYSSVDLGELKKQCRISFDILFGSNVKNFYVFLNSDKDNEKAYYVGIDLVAGRMTFDRWPRKRSDYPFMLELERLVEMEEGGKHHIDIIRDGDIIETYLDNKYAMSARMNEYKDGTFGFSVALGEVEIDNLEYMGLEMQSDKAQMVNL